MVTGPLEYRLLGNQAEPTASLWLDDVTHVRVPNIAEITRIAESPPSPDNRLALDFAADFPFDPAKPSEQELERQLDVLVALSKARARLPYPAHVRTADQVFQITPLSRFLQLQPVPFGAIFDLGHAQEDINDVLEQHARILRQRPIVKEGRELARMFESETPGLYHRHALNWALFNRADVSPPRHARLWMALDVTIYAALSAAWHYKWLRQPYNRLIRPREYDLTRENRLRVLFDRKVNDRGQEPGEDRACPEPSPGTPRHPAWPSGHSTYSAAASHILEYFISPASLGESDAALFADFPPGSDAISEPRWIAAELRRLANNIGEARLWAGVHWISDHVAGQKIGRSTAQAVIEQLERDCVPDFKLTACNSTDLPPTDAQIATMAGRGSACVPGHDTIEQPGERGASFRAEFGTF